MNWNVFKSNPIYEPMCNKKEFIAFLVIFYLSYLKLKNTLPNTNGALITFVLNLFFLVKELRWFL